MVRQGQAWGMDDGERGESEAVPRSVQQAVWYLSDMTTYRCGCLHRLLLAFSLICGPGTLHAQPRCGVDRWPVKVLADRDRASVAIGRPISATVSQLGALDIPEVTYPEDRRLPPHELRLYRVTAIVWQVITTEDDRDWHIVLRDPADNSTMIVEIPDPVCTTDKQLAAQFEVARSALRRVPRRGIATFTGVGFWDFIHNQRGRARNGFELHPVLRVELIPN